MIAGMLAGAAGIVVATRLPVLPGLAAIAVGVALAAALACRRRPLPRLATCLVLGLAWGCLRGHELLARVLPPALEGRELPVRLEAVDGSLGVLPRHAPMVARTALASSEAAGPRWRSCSITSSRASRQAACTPARSLTTCARQGFRVTARSRTSQ